MLCSPVHGDWSWVCRADFGLSAYVDIEPNPPRGGIVCRGSTQHAHPRGSIRVLSQIVMSLSRMCTLMHECTSESLTASPLVAQMMAKLGTSTSTIARPGRAFGVSPMRNV